MLNDQKQGSQYAILKIEYWLLGLSVDIKIMLIVLAFILARNFLTKNYPKYPYVF
ncbi:hypothetical protein LM900335_120099 [Listeria monocytogenes]|nr:hypothetical protein LM900335_120099 [Listeria monocytogenes]